MIRPIRVEIAPGELIDKITILEIKTERIADTGKRDTVLVELKTIADARTAAIPPDGEVNRLTVELKAVNEALWEIEDDCRRCLQLFQAVIKCLSRRCISPNLKLLGFPHRNTCEAELWSYPASSFRLLLKEIDA